jgi:hypothetical protein
MTDPEDLPPGVEERLDALLLEGNREAVLESFMREVVALPEEELSAFRAQPACQDRLAADHAITHEHRAERQGVFDAEQAARVCPRIAARTVVDGSGGTSPREGKARVS